ncbi:putative MFS transporter [Mycena rosella]|uniref:MFS transporter n=1 Tax=Mycena rosella TaxID=1033263 RepID=A0AAD7M7H7_MYCRO|nr:putative MFS transporter [Mycena rosella]
MDTTRSENACGTGSALPPTTVDGSSFSLDKAIVYLENHANSQSDATEGEIDQARLLRKIDLHIVPIALAAYTLQFLDKVDLNYAAVMGLNLDLGLVGNNFNNVGSATYIANLVAELPTGYIVQKVRPGKWLGMNIILWGVVTACTAAVTNYRGLLVCRILLGILEAATPPCLMLITSMWYTKSEAIWRFSIWYCGLGIAQILGSLISWGFQQVPHEALSGWRIMFVVLGCVTAAAGVWALISLPDSPMEVAWLTESEKRVAIQRVAANQTGIKHTHFKWQHLQELIMDPQMWFLTAMTVLPSMSSGVITFYSSTLIRNFGFSAQRSALLNMPSGAVSILASLTSAYFAYKSENCALVFAVYSCIAAVGSGLMSFLSSSNRAGLLVGIYLVNMETVTLFLNFWLTTSNVAGHTKRAASNALIAGAFAVGNIVGPQLFKPKDAPQFIPAKIVLLSTQLSAAVISVGLRVYYGYKNKTRDAAEQTMTQSGELRETKKIEWLNITDTENATFRYRY